MSNDALEQLHDFIEVWALTIADFFRQYGLDVPPAEWNVSDVSSV